MLGMILVACAILLLLALTGLLGLLIGGILWLAVHAVILAAQALTVAVGCIMWLGWACIAPRRAVEGLREAIRDRDARKART